MWSSSCGATSGGWPAEAAGDERRSNAMQGEYVGTGRFIPRRPRSDGNKPGVARYLIDDDPESADPLAPQAGGVLRLNRPERLARMGSLARAAQCQSIGGPHERNRRVDPAFLVSDVVRHACSTTDRLE